MTDEPNPLMPGAIPTVLEVALNEIPHIRVHVDSSVEALREIDSVTPVERRQLNGMIDDCAADVGRLQTAMQRLMERTEGDKPNEP